MRYSSFMLPLFLFGCNQVSKDTNADSQPQDSGVPVDTASDDTSSDSDTNEDFPADLPLEGFGEITGECGVLIQGDMDNSSALMIENSIDFASLTLDAGELTPGGQEIYNEGNLNSSSIYSEIFAYEMLYRCETASLLQTETEIDYIDPSGKKTDLIVTIREQPYGVSVTRAYGSPPEDPCAEQDAEKDQNHPPERLCTSVPERNT